MAKIWEPCSSSLHGSTEPLDPKRCKAEVWPNERWPRAHQCGRKPTKDGWCSTHHPDAEQERARKSDERYKQANRKAAMGFYGERMMAALIKIRDGANDPQQTAIEALEVISYARDL